MNETRSALYHIASAVFTYPTGALVADLKSGALVAAATEVAAAYGWAFDSHALATWAEEQTVAALQTAMEVEHVRLFVSNPAGLPAPPYSGFYLDGGRVGGESLDRLRAAYQADGLTMSPAYRDLPDHVAVQAEYLHLLAPRGEAGQGRAVLKTLVTWLPQFHQRIARAAETPFYPTWSGWFLELSRRDLKALDDGSPRITDEGRESAAAMMVGSTREQV